MATRNDSTKVQLVVVGSVGIDAIATPLESRTEVLGGAATHACAAASFFARTGIVGVVGSDFSGANDRVFSSFGIDLAGLQRAPGPTFRWSGVYEEDFVNRRTLSTELGVFADFRPELPEAYRAVRHLLLGNIGPELQLRVLNQALGAEFVAVDTMDLWIRIAQDALREVIRRATMLTLNDGEARLLTGRHNLRDCAADLLALGPRHVIIKKGEHGALLFTGDDIVILAAYPVREVVDPTGAGDTFAGACMGYLAAQGSVDREAIIRGLRYGSVVASFGVQAFGVESLTRLDLPGIEARVAELRAMVR